MQNVNEAEARDASNGNPMAGGVRAAEPSAALNPGCLEQGKGRKWERNGLLPLALQSCEGRALGSQAQ